MLSGDSFDKSEHGETECKQCIVVAIFCLRQRLYQYEKVTFTFDKFGLILLSHLLVSISDTGGERIMLQNILR